MKRSCLIVCFVLFCGTLFAQQDSVYFQPPSIETTAPITTESADTTLTIDTWRPDPMRAVWMGLIIPGYGQIYNRAYWKLPIVYGGFMGCIYAISWNGTMYNDYKQAYRDILTDTDGTKTSYMDLLPEGYTLEMMGGKDNYTRVLKNKQDMYRRYRDYSILATVLVYALSVIDAYVDAQLFDYDISTDLSMHVQPQIYTDPFNRKSAEISFAIDF